MATEKKAPAKRKKAPPKGKRVPPKHAVVKRGPGRPPAAQALAPYEDSRMSARRAAAVVYITDVVHYCTIEQLAKMPMFEHLSLGVYKRWAKLDRWSEQRKRFETMLNDRAEREMANKLLRERRAELEKAHALYQDMIGTLSNKKTRPEPKSFEGMVGAFVKLGQYIEALRVVTLDNMDLFKTTPVEGEGEQQEVVRKIHPDLSPEEMRAAASAILEARRARHREEHGIVDEADPDLLDG